MDPAVKVLEASSKRGEEGMGERLTGAWCVCVCVLHGVCMMHVCVHGVWRMWAWCVCMVHMVCMGEHVCVSC